ncbi:hypothetical protein B0H16DRAFT_1475979 [Mycena metata]|uniref:Uncharacterized protein n=1 Tax=Mycena metata TaxID=1033252 RepID=A0AAD7MHW4_9AGAR|nr:hypothetical protein B0H16DRAFT_1475979 [Mycena metata]
MDVLWQCWNAQDEIAMELLLHTQMEAAKKTPVNHEINMWETQADTEVQAVNESPEKLNDDISSSQNTTLSKGDRLTGLELSSMDRSEQQEETEPKRAKAISKKQETTRSRTAVVGMAKRELRGRDRGGSTNRDTLELTLAGRGAISCDTLA